MHPWFSESGTNSKSSPSPLDVPVRRACLPSTLSRVEYLVHVSLNQIDGGTGGHSHPHAKSEAVVNPSGALKYLVNSPLPIKHRVRNRKRDTHGSHHIWHKNLNDKDIGHDPHEPKKGHHVGGHPHRHNFDEGIPLSRGKVNCLFRGNVTPAGVQDCHT